MSRGPEGRSRQPSSAHASRASRQTPRGGATAKLS